MRKFFPKRFFPSKLSIVAYMLFLTTLVTLITTIGVMPTIHKELGVEYQQPRVLNSLALVGFLGGMGLYAIEHSKHKEV